MEIKTNDRFDKLTNLDIATHYKDWEGYLMQSDFMGAFAYWIVSQSPYLAPEIDAALKAFGRYVSSAIAENDVKRFTYSELQDFINEDVLAAIPEIEIFNHAKIERKGFVASSSRFHKTKPDYDYIDLGALAHNIFYMVLRESITQGG